MQDVFNAANRSNTAIYTVDPRGLATGEFDINENVGMQRSNDSLRQTQDTLRVLADETDGRAIVNRNDLARAMKQIVADSSAYYLIGYNSTQAPQDGKFHEIKVRVKRPGVEVRARKGYWALTAVGDGARHRAAEAGPAAGGEPGAVVDRRAVARPLRAHLGRHGARRRRQDPGHVRVGADPAAARPAARATRRRSRSSPRRRTARPYFRGDVADAARCGRRPRPAAPRVRHRVTFDVPPGQACTLRMSINGADGQLDSDDREVVVPDLTAAEVTLTTPRVFVARTAREFQAIIEGSERRADRVARVPAHRSARHSRPTRYAPGNAHGHA